MSVILWIALVALWLYMAKTAFSISTLMKND